MNARAPGGRGRDGAHHITGAGPVKAGQRVSASRLWQGCFPRGPKPLHRKTRSGTDAHAGFGAQKRFRIGGASLPLMARETPSAISAWQAWASALREPKRSIVSGGWN